MNQHYFISVAGTDGQFLHHIEVTSLTQCGVYPGYPIGMLGMLVVIRLIASNMMRHVFRVDVSNLVRGFSSYRRTWYNP